MIAAVVCLWEINPLADSIGPGVVFPKRWTLVEAYGVDQDGYACTPNKHAGSYNRDSYTEWVCRKIWWDTELRMGVEHKPDGQGESDFEWDPRPGRAVTVCSLLGGVQLSVFNPPEPYPTWLGTEFGDNLKKLPNWAGLIRDGHILLLGTEKAARTLLVSK